MGDIGDYRKYGLLRAVAASGLLLAVNWYCAVPRRPGKQEDGKFTSYLGKPEVYRYYDPELFDCLAHIVKNIRSITNVENSGILKAQFFEEALTGMPRHKWHENALAAIAGADIVFLDPDNGLETAKMRQHGHTKDKHAKWQKVKDYYDRGQSVILYQHRPQMMKKETCIQGILDFQNSFLKADSTLLLEYPRYTNRYYFIFVHDVHRTILEDVYHSVTQSWNGPCSPVVLCLTGSQ